MSEDSEKKGKFDSPVKQTEHGFNNRDNNDIEKTKKKDTTIPTNKKKK